MAKTKKAETEPAPADPAIQSESVDPEQAAPNPDDGRPKTIRMVRGEPMHPRGPTTADVHPLEVENMKRFGWVEAQE